MIDTAFESAKYSTFQTKLGTRGDFLDQGAKLQSLKSGSGPATFLANYYLPFIQTPTNVAGFVLERFPGMNFILKRYRDDFFSENPVVRQQAKAKMMLGSAFFTTVMGMTYGGYATGTSPELGTDFNLKGSKYAMQKTMGIGTGTINIPYGDTTIRVNTRDVLFDPVAMSFKQAADLAAIIQMGFNDRDQAQDFARVLAAFVYSTGENLASSTFMSGISKGIKDYQMFEQLGAVKGTKRWGKDVFINTFVPSIVKQGGKVVGAFNDTNYQKVAVEFDEYVAKALNSSSLNAQYDFLGNRVQGWGGYTIENNDPILDEWRNTRVELSPIKKGKPFRQNGVGVKVEYTSDEYSFLQKRSGEYNKEVMPLLFETDEYQEADNFYKQALIKKAHSNSQARAYADLIGNEEGNEPDGSFGFFEGYEDTRLRIDEKAKELYQNKLTTLNFGKPLENDYFGEEE